jgi:hypothetical protein
MKPERKPGLPSVYKAREDRQRGKFSRATPAFWLWAGSGLVALLVGYRFVSGRQLGSDKGELLAKQRAVRSSIGPTWFPLRDRIEGLTVQAASRVEEDSVNSQAAHWDFRALPGLYLRLRVADARDVPTVRRAAFSSQKDGFVGCFLREPNPRASAGEVDAGVFAEQPWNWQKAYEATRILTDEWTSEVNEAPDPLRLRVFQEQYEKAIVSEIPLAIDLAKRAQFFLLVLDEDSEEANALADGGPASLGLLERMPHYARVHLWNLATGKELVRVRRAAEANFLFAGEHEVSDPETLDAMKRQVNNCALAKEVDRALAAATDAGAP